MIHLLLFFLISTAAYADDAICSLSGNLVEVFTRNKDLVAEVGKKDCSKELKNVREAELQLPDMSKMTDKLFSFSKNDSVGKKLSAEIVALYLSCPAEEAREETGPRMTENNKKYVCGPGRNTKTIDKKNYDSKMAKLSTDFLRAFAAKSGLKLQELKAGNGKEFLRAYPETEAQVKWNGSDYTLAVNAYDVFDWPRSKYAVDAPEVEGKRFISASTADARAVGGVLFTGKNTFSAHTYGPHEEYEQLGGCIRKSLEEKTKKVCPDKALPSHWVSENESAIARNVPYGTGELYQVSEKTLQEVFDIVPSAKSVK